MIAANPAESARPPSLRRAEQRALTENEVRDLLSSAIETRFAAPIRVSLATGLRQGELLSLRWEDVDVEARLLRVRRRKSRNSRRAVELSGETLAVFAAHRVAQNERRLRRGPVWRDHGLVFPSRVGTRWEANNFYRGYKRLVATSGMDSPETLKWHTLRHAAATLWIKAGADIHSVSRRLGHASAAFTMDVYGHLLPGQQQQAAEALDHLIS